MPKKQRKNGSVEAHLARSRELGKQMNRAGERVVLGLRRAAAEIRRSAA